MITPFQREEGRGPVFTPEEVAWLEGRAEDRVVSGAEPRDPDRPLPSAGGDIGNYNDVYFERGVRVAVINGEPRSSLLTNPPNGRRPPLTPEAQRRQQERTEFRSQFRDADHPENLSLTVRCLMFGSNVGPPMVPNGAYNNNYTIVQTADYVVIHAEVVHDTRIIRIGDGPRLPDHVRPWMGDSWGRWEGDALVVETTNIYPLHTEMALHRFGSSFPRFVSSMECGAASVSAKASILPWIRSRAALKRACGSPWFPAAGSGIGQCSRRTCPGSTGHTSSSQSVTTRSRPDGSIVSTDFEYWPFMSIPISAMASTA